MYQEILRGGCTKMKFNTLKYFFIDALKSLRRNRTLSIAAMI
ncbi:ABC transporter permease, partial [Clostridium perfringens]|nr:ABC transporter permease [Clostridium perfringens]